MTLTNSKKNKREIQSRIQQATLKRLLVIHQRFGPNMRQLDRMDLVNLSETIAWAIVQDDTIEVIQKRKR